MVDRERAGEERLEAAIASSIDGMAILDDEGTYVYVNDAHADIYGYDGPADLLGESWRRLYDADEIEWIERDVLPELARTG